MMWKAVGICMIVLSCFGLGMIKSAEIQKRYRLLKEWERLILLIRQEVSYNEPLPEAYRKVGSRARPPFDCFLKNLSDHLKVYGGKSFSEVFDEEISRCLSSSCLSKEDLLHISMMGEMAGFTDRQMQMEMLNRYGKELEIKLADLKEQLPGRQKLYRSLGFLGGVFLGILLL